MNSIKSINTFLSDQPIALVGVSRNKKKFGYKVYSGLLRKGYNVIPVNPHTDMIGQNKCYKDIKNLPPEVNSVIMMTDSDKTDMLVNEAISRGVKNIWIQQHSETKTSVELARSHNINLITGKCILMFTKPSGPHKFHAFLSKLFGKYPK